MNEVFTRRVKDQLPTVLLTLLSIVQALALELMWEHVRESAHLYVLSFAALLAWLQLGATFLGLLLVWLIYISLVMRFRWVPTTTDLIFPFLIGILEFLLVATLAPALLAAWFVTLAIVFVAMSWGSQGAYRRARLDGENDEYFAQIAPATLRDFLPVAAVATTLAAAGLFIWITGDRGWFALVALVVAVVFLSVQFRSSSAFWRRTFEQTHD